MRVALDVTPLLGTRTGVAQTVDGLLAGLRRTAPDVEVLPYALSLRGRSAPEAAALPTGTRFLPVPAGLAIRAWGHLDLSVDGLFRGADIVHGTNFVVPPLRDRPASVTVHDCWCARHPDTCDPVSRSFTPALRRAIGRGAWVHVSTSFVADEVRELYGAERVAVVPFGVPPVERAAPAPEPGPPFVLALGTMEPRKNLDGLVRAFGCLAALPGVPGDLRLVLAGPDGPAGPDVDAAVAALPPDVAARVERRGAVDDDTRRHLLADARVVAYPSRSEGFGFPLLEAMANGVPVVATAVGAIPEVAGGAAWLVPLDDDDALAAALARLVCDDVERGHFVTAGMARATAFSWDRTAAGMVELWRRATAVRGR